MNDGYAQAMFLPETIEQYVPVDSPVRAIDAFIESLDLRALKFTRQTPAAATGRPAYAPGDLLKLFVFGCLNGVRSREGSYPTGAANGEAMMANCETHGSMPR